MASRRSSRRNKPVPFWNRPATEVRAELVAAEAAAVAAGFSTTLRLRGLPKIPKSQLLTVPEPFPPSFYIDQATLLNGLFRRPPARRLRIRKDQRRLTGTEWRRFLFAYATLADLSGFPGLVLPDPPQGRTLEDFVDVHVDAMTTSEGGTWGVHTGLSNGRNFLAWHREFLTKFEAALMTVNPLVSIPYWNWVDDPMIPEPLVSPLLGFIGVRRQSFDPSLVPSAALVNETLDRADFTTFQSSLEGRHNRVHQAFGMNSTMLTPGSPLDPAFWLHHAFIDKIWAVWQARNPGGTFNPSNVGEELEPAPLLTRTVGEVLDIRKLGYVYE